MKMKRNFLFLAIVAFVLILPSQQAQAAGLGEIISGAINSVIMGGLDLFMMQFVFLTQVIQGITLALPFIAVELLKMVIALNGTLHLTPLNADSGEMVKVGFNFTRDLANMFFIIILAWIGFATILRLETYQVKKMLPKLILIALLINFIPVICGVIIDISDIVTTSLLSGGDASGFGKVLINQLPAADIVKGGLDGLTMFIPSQGGITGIVIKSAMGSVFNLVAFFVLMLYVLIFILRIVAIWILIVLAPLAWLGYILPEGKKYWDMWWKQFLQWAMIGIPMTFFLFLSGLVLGGTSIRSTSCPAVDFAEYGWGSGILAAIAGPFLCSTLPFIAAIIVLIIGFLASITFSPMGADAVMKAGKKGGMAASKVLGPQAWKGVKEYTKTTGGFAAGIKAPFRFAKGFRDYQKNAKAERLTLGGRRPISPGLMMEEGMEAEDIRQPRPSTGQKIAAGAKEFGKATASGLGKTGIGGLKGKSQAAKTGTWDTIKKMAKTGGAAAVGIKLKKTPRGTKRCPDCPNYINVDDDVCRFCGHIFKLEEKTEGKKEAPKK